MNKVLVKEFYRSNASFFLVVIGLGAGFMRSYEHIALAEFFVSSSATLLIPVIIWILYALKVIRFNLDMLNRNENEFLYQISLLPWKEQVISTMRTILLQLMPMVLYAIFLMTMAWKHNVTQTLVLIFLSCLSIIILSSLKLRHELGHPHVQKNIWMVTRFLNTKFIKPYFLFFPEWILRREALMIVGTKLFSGSILFGVAELYKTDQYDLRLFGMGSVLAFSANVNIMWELHRFDNFHLTILHNLPLSFIKRVAYFSLTTSLLILPEIGIVIKNFPAGFSATDHLSVVLFDLSIPVLFYGYLYVKDIPQDKLMTIVFFIAIALVVLVLFQVPLFILTIINLVIGLSIWRRCYYSFELISKKDS